uniref:Filamin A interacting protein 1 like n=1 Tax=Takifugu rubripes TaxID=31033 RepID=A0A674MYM3_TAKRU
MLESCDAVCCNSTHVFGHVQGPGPPSGPGSCFQGTYRGATVRLRRRKSNHHFSLTTGRGDLSRDDLLFLLSILEGELQARDEVIAVLESERTDSARLAAQYGFSGPENVLRALRRDSLRAQTFHLENVYKNPIAEVLRPYGETIRHHMVLLMKRNELSISFFNRLELLIAKENEYHEIKRKKSEKEVSFLKEELTELKALALLVVKEQRRLKDLLEDQGDCIKELTEITDRLSEDTSAAASHPKTDRVSTFSRRHVAMTAPILPFEVEILKRRNAETEGKDEELLRMWDQCRDLDRRLAQETSRCRSLRAVVDKLNGRISEMDRIEEDLGKSKVDCSVLKSSLEQEKEANKNLSSELVTLKARVREMEANQGKCEKSEATIRQDLAKFKSLTVALVEERKSMTERLRQAEEKLNRKESKRKEQSNPAFLTGKVSDERPSAESSKADLEERMKQIAKEKGHLQERLQTEERRSRALQSEITIMKKRLQVLENMKEKENAISKNSNLCQIDDNKVQELTKELEWLRRTLQDKELLEGQLKKVEENFRSLEKRFREEQKRCQALTAELEVAKMELSRYDQAEKQEVNQEHLLLLHLQKEQVKSRLLSKEVNALKEKLQKLAGTDESICRVQTDQHSLQRKLAQQEIKNKELAKEMKELLSELERCRQLKNLVPAANRQLCSASQTTKEVQTEERGLPPEGIDPGLGDDEECRDEDVEMIHRRRSSLVNNLNCLNSANNNSCQYSAHAAPGRDETLNGDVMMVTHTPGQPLHIKLTPHHTLNTATLEITSPTGDAGASYTSTAVIPTNSSAPKQRITIIQNSALSPVSPKSGPSSPEQTASPLNDAPFAQLSSPHSSRSVTPDHNGAPIQIVTVRTCSPEPTEAANATPLHKSAERRNSWQTQKSKSSDSGIITTEDNKIHIHLGSPYMQSLNSMTHSITQPVGPYFLRHEQRTQVLANGCHITGVGKITSSITISPDSSPTSQPPNITVNTPHT